MQILSLLMIAVGLAVFLTGFYYLGQSHGGKECKKPNNEEIEANYNGGIAGMVIGAVILIFGLFWNVRRARSKLKVFGGKAKSSLIGKLTSFKKK
jgi:uncharacterized protein HemY